MVESRQGFDSTNINNGADPYNQPTAPEPSPSDKEKNNGLGRALIGGLIGGTLGSLAAVLAARKIQEGSKQTSKDVKTGTDAVQNTPEGVDQSVQYAADTFNYKAVDAQPSQTPSNQYQDRINTDNQQPIYTQSPTSTRSYSNSPSLRIIEVTPFHAESVEEELNPVDISPD